MTNIVEYLRSPQAIRDRCEQLFDLAQTDKLAHFRVDLTQLDVVADYVIAVTREHYPDLNVVPFHSRWRHFEAGGISRWSQLPLSAQSPIDQAKAKFDLVIPSVLLDAGAGDRWKYHESRRQVWTRSEGLAIASFDAFCQGAFSNQPYQTDAAGLKKITPDTIAKHFQVSPENPLVGLEGRATLLQKLGQTIEHFPDLFGKPSRPGNLVDYLIQQSEQGQLSATIVFGSILRGLGEIWSGRLSIEGVNLGDVWHHSALLGDWSDQLIPFHKLSQWLTYSLLEPLQALGLKMTDLDRLTGLPEYRNGGLCIDLGLLQLKDPQQAMFPHAPDSELIVEWRALTICLLDRIAATIRNQINQDSDSLPLVKVLQGGTWTAGRKIAASLRPNGTPPIQIFSDGTVF